jgi:septum formation topological specificity factor MinE
MPLGMKYYKINRSYEPSITGVNDASAQVEIFTKPTKHSFANEKERQYFSDFADLNRRDTGRVSIDSFVSVDTSKISIINVSKTKKRIKEVDVMYYMPRFTGFDIVFSEKILEVIEKYKLSDYNKINIKVEDFDTLYYLIGFPMIDIPMIDFPKSIFYADFYRKELVFNDYKKYRNYNGLADPKRIMLKNKFDFDVLKIPFGIFFSEKLVDEIEKMELKALEIDKHTTLEC